MNRILISRTDSIGDVVLTLPVAAALKREFPGCTVIFLGSEYTRPVVERCRYVDEFAAWTEGGSAKNKVQSTKDEGVDLLRGLQADAVIHAFPVRAVCRAAKTAGIPVRVATAGRFFTWNSCNRRVWVPRKNSSLHEAQLNLALLKGLGVNHFYETGEIGTMYGMDRPTAVRSGSRRSVILHPKSKGSAREWGLDNFSKLIGLLPESDYGIAVTGTREEGLLMKDFLDRHRHRVEDLTGRLTLGGLIDRIAASDALVAASTGPLHIAAALGIRAIGLYAPMRPIFPTRWAPLGPLATHLVVDRTCNQCRKSFDCECIRSIPPEEVAARLVP